MGAESYQTKLTRVRKPRVHITYNVETGGAIEKKELPLVVGVMGDLSGDRDPAKPLPKLKDRKFVKIDRDDFDSVMEKIGGSYTDVDGKVKGISPRLAVRAKNTLQNDGTELSATLEFKKLSDFNPENVVKQIPVLANLLDLRAKLSNLRSSIAGNDRLEELLQEVITNAEKAPGTGSKTDTKGT
jgi:type VI secretion system protein ImpB